MNKNTVSILVPAMLLVAFPLCAPILLAQDARTAVQAGLTRMVPDKRPPDDILLTGQRTDPSGTVPFRMTIKGKDQARYEIGTGATQVTTTFSKGAGSRVAAGKVEILQSYTARERPALIPFLDLLAEADAPALQVTDQGAFSIGNLAARRYTLKLPDPEPQKRMFGRPLDEESDVYIDLASGLIVRSERWVMAENSMDVRFRRITEFSDYRSVNGLAIPFRVAETVQTPTRAPFQSVYVVVSASVNTGVDDTVFTGTEPRQ